jgi:hypothetical protein
MRRRRTAQDKKLREDSYLIRTWRRWHRELALEALQGPHGTLVEQVFEILRTMDLRDTRILNLARATNWGTIDQQTKYVLIHEIDRRIITLREQAGLLPFSDALPHERPRGFLIIRAMMGTMPGDPGQIVETTNE